ncbi:carbohydrate ABC transporter membrane protein 2 [[Clostridium] cellulosi]|jgi:Binding-protein-dependent transport system inner membrane component.|uniref:Carbohydrate ABC transporter membrane protein 2 n=1 Tax=[Clostridium] cellulosi TaxID=29343 RepID=A0A078KR33_9FIRM|nr:MAG: carbohydrate ABC transporter permease [[Clostridium] cellulosi]CDZ24952.1 carbohydrate ABC transporter membrane protein 2 [[Clostridium] cellulosi]
MEAARTYKKSKPINAISMPINIVFNVVLIIVTLLCILPIVLIFMISISDERILIEQGYTFFPKKISFATYEYLFKDTASLLDAYKVTIFTTVVGTAISTAMTMMYAYPISRKSFKYRNVFSFIIFFTMLFQGGLVPWYILYTRYLHINDTLLALIMPGFVSAFNCLIIRTFFRQGLPDEILDAAKVDGAGEFYTFVRIVIPLSTPAIATIALFQALFYWNDWYICMLFIQDSKLFNLQYSLYQALNSLEALSSNSVNAAGVGSAVNVPTETMRMAMAILSIGPIVLAYPFFQRYFVKGLTIGAVKG